MRIVTVIFFLTLGVLSSHAEIDVWCEWFVPKLGQLELERINAAEDLKKLGTPVVGQTTPEIGFQREHLKIPPLSPDWVQIDLQERQPIDSIALVPAIMDWQSVDKQAYAFPLRFRVDISDDEKFEKPTSVGIFTSEDFPNPGVAPVTFPVGGKSARYVRLTVTKLAEENSQFFFALSEIMVLSGNLNIAIGCPVHAAASVETSLRFSQKYLVDGRTHLGPPIKRQLLEWDGLHAGDADNEIPPLMQLNLGKILSIQQVRLHPVHAHIGADVPGFRFPKTFRLEASLTPDFRESIILMDVQDYSNPGNNPVTIPLKNVSAQYLKITSLEKDKPGGPRFSMSEIEVYSDGTNAARGATVTRTPDKFPNSRKWPRSILVDGFTSYGRLMELPEWLRDWEKRRTLQNRIKKIEQEEIVLTVKAHQRATLFGISTALISIITVAGFTVASRRRQERELHNLRLRLARDLHDEIGSNLAGIAVLSEVAQDSNPIDSTQREDWREINQIAHETLGAMREVIWLVGGKEEAGLDLMTHLHLAASRILAGKEVHWESTSGALPSHWTMETKRQIFLFFKEALTNIVRHSQATRVELSAHISEKEFLLRIVDNGSGFNLEKVQRGIGLSSQEMRARAINGTVKIISMPGEGTNIELKIPLNRTRKYFSFAKKLRKLEA